MERQRNRKLLFIVLDMLLCNRGFCVLSIRGAPKSILTSVCTMSPFLESSALGRILNNPHLPGVLGEMTGVHDMTYVILTISRSGKTLYKDRWGKTDDTSAVPGVT